MARRGFFYMGKKILKKYHKNPRTLTEKQFNLLQRDLKELGDISGIIHDIDTDEIIGGNQRSEVFDINNCEIEIAKEYKRPTKTGTIAEGFIIWEGEKYSYRKVKWTEKQCEKANIVANKAGGNWDFDVLANDFEVDDLLDWGFDESELVGGSDEGAGGLTDEDDVPEVPEEPTTKLGDLYKLGEHRLLCGDATNIQHVERLMDGEMADMNLTDPPYNVDYTGKTKDALKIDNDKKCDGDFRQFLKDAFISADSVMKPGAVFYIWHADLEGYNFRGACHDIGWQVRQCLVWNKNSMVMGRQDYHWKHEPCLYGWKDGASHLWATDRKQVTVLEFARRSQNKEHPTMKPVDLLEYQIKNNTKGMDMVLDLFGGSGSTLIACEKTKRKCRMMELDPKYCDVIVKRWEEYTGETAELINGI
jgi:site-specific DNA-methyltransferase (adenine-specific)